MAYKTFNNCIDDMVEMAQTLMPQTYPQATTTEELEIDSLKQYQFLIDGYEVIAHLSWSQYSNCRIEYLEIASASSPFLPMFLICKIATRLLGQHELKYHSTFKQGRKVYIWTVAVDNSGRPIKLNDSHNLISHSYENFKYTCIEEF